jgi:hypothetical protein
LECCFDSSSGHTTNFAFNCSNQQTFNVFVSALSADVPDQRSIVNGPLNEALEYGPGIELTCEASGPGERVQWSEFNTNPNGAPISDNELLLPGHPNVARYTLDHPEGSTIYNLGINPTVLSDAGTYRCQDTSDTSTPTYAQLVLLGTALT